LDEITLYKSLTDILSSMEMGPYVTNSETGVYLHFEETYCFHLHG